ncbi:MAG: hypothetical protein QW220_06740 [Candidatus Bathyarchaeia archaeon]
MKGPLEAYDGGASTTGFDTIEYKPGGFPMGLSRTGALRHIEAHRW